MLGDGCVGVAFGQQAQELPFARGQRPQGVVPPPSGQQLGNDVGVEHCRAVGDPVQGVQELFDSGDPVFQ